MIDAELLDILACPACRAEVRLEGDRIVCTSCGLRYPISEDGYPVLLIDQAERPAAEPQGGAETLRIAIISDIHANIEALTAVLDHIADQKVQDIVCLGDVIGYGPNPRECIEIVRNGRFCLMGNHEEAVMFYGEDFNEKARQALEWTKEQLNSPQYDRTKNYEMWNFLGSLEESRTEGDVLFVHGSPRVPTKEYMVPTDIRNREKMTEIFSMIPSLCFVGHSHIGVYTDGFQFLSPDRIGGAYVHQSGKALVNAGSVGQPRDGDPRASYVVFDGRTVRFHRVEYDVRTTMDKIYATPGLPNYLADRLIVGR